MEQLGLHCDCTLVPKVKKVTLSFWAPDKRAADLTNKAESIMDLLVDRGILSDDNWHIIPNIELQFKGIDKINPRCYIYIEREGNEL